MTTDDAIMKEISKIMGWEYPLLCDGLHPKGGCNLERAQQIISRIRSQSEADGARKEREYLITKVRREVIGEEFYQDRKDALIRIENEKRATLRHAVEKGSNER